MSLVTISSKTRLGFTFIRPGQTENPFGFSEVDKDEQLSTAICCG